MPKYKKGIFRGERCSDVLTYFLRYSEDKYKTIRSLSALISFDQSLYLCLKRMGALEVAMLESGKNVPTDEMRERGKKLSNYGKKLSKLEVDELILILKTYDCDPLEAARNSGHAYNTFVKYAGEKKVELKSARVTRRIIEERGLCGGVIKRIAEKVGCSPTKVKRVLGNL